MVSKIFSVLEICDSTVCHHSEETILTTDNNDDVHISPSK